MKPVYDSKRNPAASGCRDEAHVARGTYWQGPTWAATLHDSSQQPKYLHRGHTLRGTAHARGARKNPVDTRETRAGHEIFWAQESPRGCSRREMAPWDTLGCVYWGSGLAVGSRSAPRESVMEEGLNGAAHAAGRVQLPCSKSARRRRGLKNRKLFSGRRFVSRYRRASKESHPLQQQRTGDGSSGLIVASSRNVWFCQSLYNENNSMMLCFQGVNDKSEASPECEGGGGGIQYSYRRPTVIRRRRYSSGHGKGVGMNGTGEKRPEGRGGQEQSKSKNHTQSGALTRKSKVWKK